MTNLDEQTLEILVANSVKIRNCFTEILLKHDIEHQLKNTIEESLIQGWRNFFAKLPVRKCLGRKHDHWLNRKRVFRPLEVDKPKLFALLYLKHVSLLIEDFNGTFSIIFSLFCEIKINYRNLSNLKHSNKLWTSWWLIPENRFSLRGGSGLFQQSLLAVKYPHQRLCYSGLSSINSASNGVKNLNEDVNLILLSGCSKFDRI